MKRLANLKSSSSSSDTPTGPIGFTKRNIGHFQSKSKKSSVEKNHPYPASGRVNTDIECAPTGTLTFSTPTFRSHGNASSLNTRSPLVNNSGERQVIPVISGDSATDTISTGPPTANSDTAHSTKADSSAADTNITVGGAMSSHAGGGSTFSSPAPSLRSLTTTLTTIQSTGPGQLLPGSSQGQGGHSGSATATSHSLNFHNSTNQISQFSPFPGSPPASAIPTHLAPQAASGNPSTYTAATANNLLTDNASILTLASSSKRHRRQSLDTNASVRALAPSSLWGGSRESLPLSVLSGNVGDQNNPPTPGLHHGRTSLSGVAGTERASVYSASGVAPALSSERNSTYAGKQSLAADGASVKSGLFGHGRNDSISGSVGGGGPLPIGRQTSFSGAATGRASRRNSAWVEVSEEDGTAEEPSGANGTITEGGRLAE